MIPESSPRAKAPTLRTLLIQNSHSTLDIIQLLPDSVANQIAAGEVVQRPASAVKELLENAVDAGATSIKLLVKDAGKTLIQVTDNGRGMSETDARMAFERHATSKIRRGEDLFALRTFGFRGEALASIAAVAQVELKTRQEGQELGTRLCIEGSQLKAHEPCQCPVGTVLSVKNLFFNVPARRNFLKSNNVEMRHVIDEFTRVALANPNLFFSLHHNATEQFHLPAGNLRQRVVGILGKRSNEKLVPVEEKTDTVRFNGFVGKPSMAKKTRGEQFFFVNGRFIKSGYLHQAVMNAYEGLLPEGTFPLYVLFLKLDPNRIDINVHPTKQEIKFDDEKLIFHYLETSVRHALGQYSITPTLDWDVEMSMNVAKNFGQRSGRSTDDGRSTPRSGNGGYARGGGAPSRSTAPPDHDRTERQRQRSNQRDWEKLYAGLDDFDRATPEPDLSSALRPAEATAETFVSNFSNDAPLDNGDGTFRQNSRVPYQLHGTYIVSPIKSGFLLIDQQAAHERVLYERFLQTWMEERPATQTALFPTKIQLNSTDAGTLEGMLSDISELGYVLKKSGENEYAIEGVPADLADRNPQETVETLLEQYKTNLDLQLDTRENLARSLARSTATKRGTSLTEAEMQELIDQLFACAVPFRSPAGRSCFLTFELGELERMFG